MRILASVVASLLASSVAVAQPAPPPPQPPPLPPGYTTGPSYGPGPAYVRQRGYHEHEGFYLRLFLGGGYLRASTSDPKVAIKGPAGLSGIALGGAVAPNLIVYGELFGDVTLDPTIEVGGEEFDTEDTTSGNYGVGAGLAYYIMPVNLYLSATLAASRLSFRVGDEDTSHTDFGPSVSLMVGKEWFVSHDWGLGVAAQLFIGRMANRDDGPTFTTVSGGVAFSATYN